MVGGVQFHDGELSAVVVQPLGGGPDTGGIKSALEERFIRPGRNANENFTHPLFLPEFNNQKSILRYQITSVLISVSATITIMPHFDSPPGEKGGIMKIDAKRLPGKTPLRQDAGTTAIIEGR
jgi:hypothetical protein